MLDAEATPEAIAELLRAEAPPGLTHRALEAAGWMLRAGAGNQALAWLLERRKQVEGRLFRRPWPSWCGGWPACTASLPRAPSCWPSCPRPRRRRTRARSWSCSGRGAGGGGRSRRRRRDLPGAAGRPFSADADLALRRVLWSARDFAALGSLYRDEADGLRGAGRPTAAAAFAGRAGRGPRRPRPRRRRCPPGPHGRTPGGAGQRRGPHGPARDAIQGGRFAEALPLLEEVATRDFPSAATAILALCGLLDESRAGGEQARAC
jgi:hypothetical protein